MSLVVTGLSHHTGSIDLREKLNFPQATLRTALARLRKKLDGAGVVILSTCNRVEVYAHHNSEAARVQQEIRAFLCEWHDLPEEAFRDALYEHQDREAAGHLFRVASSLDSLVVGEAQILGQVRDAYLAAQTEQTTDKVINNLFQQAFGVAKAVRTRTNIGAGKVSVSSVAVDLAASIFMELPGKTVMVVGSGEMGELTLSSLVARGVGNVLVINRHADRAAALAGKYQGQPLPWEELPLHLHKADIVISTTSSPHYILRTADFLHALKERGRDPIFAIDIAVPRDIEPAVGELTNVYLYDIDDLQQVVNQNVEARRKEVAQSMAIVEREVNQFMRWMSGLAAEPTIVSMAEELHTIRERELRKTLASLPDLTQQQKDEIAYLTERIVKSILQRPMTQIKQEIGHHDPGTVIHLVKRLFGLEET